MSQFLGLMTAYGAVAILAWLVVLLHPRLLSATHPPPLADRQPAKHRIALTALVPTHGIGRSLALGLALAAAGLAAWCSTLGRWGDLPALAASLPSTATALLAARMVLIDLALAALLAVLAERSRWAALAMVTLLAVAVHLAPQLKGGIEAADLLAGLAAGTIGLALCSAILATRNVLWFMPAHLALELVQAFAR